MSETKSLQVSSNIRLDDLNWQSGVFASVNYRYYSSRPQSTSTWCLLMHGHPGCVYSWRYTVPFLQQLGYGVILPEMLGYGGTDKPLDVAEYRFSKMVESLDALLSELVQENEQVVAIGHDWGSPVAARLHLRKPGRIQGLVMLAFPYLPPSPDRFDCDAFNALFRGQVGYDIIDYFKFFSGSEAPAILTEHIDSLLTIVFAKDTPAFWSKYWANGDNMKTFLLSDQKLEIADYVSEDDLAIYRRELGDGHYAARLNWYKAFLLNVQRDDDQDLVGERSHINIPALYFQGLRDAVVIPPVASIQNSFIKDLTSVDIDSDHFIMEAKPAEFHSALEAWMKSKGF